jgi:hypothetical protein
LQDTSFETIDVGLDEVEDFQLLLHTAPGLTRHTGEEIQELEAPLGGEDIAIRVQRQSVLGEGGVDAVLELGTDVGENHSSAW